MKKNSKTIICGRKVVLVPYKREHVLRYHEWMKDPVLQALTASEPLSLKEEYDMQLSWYNDEKKCTFIILDSSTYDSTGDEIASMVGDVNLFFNDDEYPKSAEIEIMIAEIQARGKGCGKEAVFAMMLYGISNLEVTSFSAKIGLSNEASLSMFKKIGFKEIAKSEVFKEMTLQLEITDDVTDIITEQTKHLEISS